jgi:hypothetical protein
MWLRERDKLFPVIVDPIFPVNPMRHWYKQGDLPRLAMILRDISNCR